MSYSSSVEVLAFLSLAGLVLGACTTTTIVRLTPEAGAPPVATSEPVDEPVADAGTKPDAADAACMPGSRAGYSGAPYEPPHPHEAKCTDRLIDAYIECRRGKQLSCDEVAEGGNPSGCMSCIDFFSPSSGWWGPFAPKGGPGSNAAGLNSAGCGALINGDTTTTGCGKALADHEGCLDFTCLDQCPKEYAACAQESGTGICKSFMDAAKAACPKDVHDCFVRKTDTNGDDVAKRIFRRFCGSL